MKICLNPRTTTQWEYTSSSLMDVQGLTSFVSLVLSLMHFPFLVAAPWTDYSSQTRSWDHVQQTPVYLFYCYRPINMKNKILFLYNNFNIKECAICLFCCVEQILEILKLLKWLRNWGQGGEREVTNTPKSSARFLEVPNLIINYTDVHSLCLWNPPFFKV